MKIKVIFSPYFKNNPYQKLLAGALKKFNVESVAINPSQLRVSMFKNNSHSLLHLHWIHPFYSKEGHFASLSSLIIFIFKLMMIRTKKVKIVWTAHNLESHENKYPLLDKAGMWLISRIAGAIIVHSKIGKDLLLKKLSINDSQKIYVIPHGNYIDYYENNINKRVAREILGIKRNSFVYLFFGRVREYKGLIKLIKTFKEHTLKNSELWIVGKSADEELTKTIEALIPPDKRIIFIDELIKKEKIQVYLNSSDVVILPYKNVLTSGSAILAMSFKKTLIVPYDGDLPWVANKKDVIFYGLSEENGLLKAMEKAFERNDQLPKMGIRCYNIIKKLKWGEIAKKTFLVYQKSIKSKSRSVFRL